MEIHVVTLNIDGDQVGVRAKLHAEKAAALASKLDAAYGDHDDVFVGIYVAAVELEAHIDDGPVNALGTPLIDHHLQQTLF